MNITVNYNIKLTDFEQNAIIKYGETIGFDFNEIEGKFKHKCRNFIKLVLKNYGTNVINIATEWYYNELRQLGYSDSEINNLKEKK